MALTRYGARACGYVAILETVNTFSIFTPTTFFPGTKNMPATHFSGPITNLTLIANDSQDPHLSVYNRPSESLRPNTVLNSVALKDPAEIVKIELSSTYFSKTNLRDNSQLR